MPKAHEKGPIVPHTACSHKINRLLYNACRVNPEGVVALSFFLISHNQDDRENHDKEEQRSLTLKCGNTTKNVEVHAKMRHGVVCSAKGCSHRVLPHQSLSCSHPTTAVSTHGSNDLSTQEIDIHYPLHPPIPKHTCLRPPIG